MAQRRANHLEGQTSPYLLQHLYNPVDWYPWCPEALARSVETQRPIFLSIGYAACHWCHVMERESFENEEVAAFLNRHFVPIKVDREERPDLDQIYIQAVQMMTGSAGWPLSVFLTPQLQPFFGGTYFPPQRRGGLVGFLELLDRVQEAWSGRREEVLRSAQEMTDQLRRLVRGPEAATAAREGPIGRAELARASYELARRHDPRWGGFGGAPKFPPDGGLALLLREHSRSGEAQALAMARTTLERMYRGGIYDHLGGGFARYSVDERWLVPHFEKMLYNQALLVPLYLDAWLLTGEPAFRRVAVQTLDFVRRELTHPEGGFFSSLDADSEGEEGRFYLWTPEQVHEELEVEQGELFCSVYGVTAGGNFEGRSILHLLERPMVECAERLGLGEEELEHRLEPLRARLLAARGRRARPATDDKVLTAWSGLMISAFARAFQVLHRPEDLLAARRAAEFLLAALRRGDRLLAVWREGRARLNGYLDDYAFFATALLDLYESCFDAAYLRHAERLARVLVERFEDREHGGFFFTSDDHERLLTRERSQHDGALPAGAGVAVLLLLRLAAHLDDEELRRPALRALEACRPAVARGASAHAALVLAGDWAEGPLAEVALVGSAENPVLRAMLDRVWQRTDRRWILGVAADGGDPSPSALLAGKTAIDGRPTAYLCRDFVCRKPTTDPAELTRQLESL